VSREIKMSRFGIRKKLKKMFLGPESPKYKTFDITYILPDGQEQVVEAEERYTVLMASQSLPSPISTGRRAGGNCPDGQCGSCRIEIENAIGLSEKNDFEQSILDAVAQGLPHEGRCRDIGSPQTPNSRLACHTRIIGSGSRIIVPALVNYDDLKGDDNGT
jgi:ferredoxin